MGEMLRGQSGARGRAQSTAATTFLEIPLLLSPSSVNATLQLLQHRHAAENQLFLNPNNRHAAGASQKFLLLQLHFVRRKTRFANVAALCGTGEIMLGRSGT